MSDQTTFFNVLYTVKSCYKLWNFLVAHRKLHIGRCILCQSKRFGFENYSGDSAPHVLPFFFTQRSVIDTLSFFHLLTFTKTDPQNLVSKRQGVCFCNEWSHFGELPKKLGMLHRKLSTSHAQFQITFPPDDRD